MSGSPILLFPWQRPFLPDLKAVVDAALDAENTDERNGRPGSALIIVPHNRPRRYLARLYAEQGQAALLPKVVTLNEVVEEACMRRAAERNALLLPAAIPDRVALLYDCVQGLAREDQALASRFARMDTARFLPWGVRLANLLEEIFRHGLDSEDLTYAETETAEPAAALLGALGRIRRAYVDALNAHGLSTAGLDYYRAAQEPETLAPFRPRPGRPVFMAGFYLLTGTEDILLRSLRQAGARLCLHTDLDPDTGAARHRACAEHAALVRRWNAKIELAPAATAHADSEQQQSQTPQRPEFFFFAGYDCHSQLQELRDILQKDNAGDTPSTAVVLTDNALLMPVLHHLPNKDVNISMGYPLERSPLNRLLLALMRLHDNASEEGLPYRRDLLQCLRHPYLNMLRVVDADGTERFLREALRLLEEPLRNGERFSDLAAAAAHCRPALPLALADLLEHCLEVIVTAPGKARTPAEAADCLSSICALLTEYGGDMWRHFPLDAEAMYRLRQHVVPELRHIIWADTVFPLTVLHALIRQVLAVERVPFEADPLTGVQVLGMLETRLLHFERVLIVDAVDDALPGNAPQDPLLPDSLRQALGLPDARGRERAAAHTLYRLCAGADNVHFFWQEGINRSSLFDGKKSRSRFVEQLIWEEEQRRNALLTPGTGPLRTARCSVRVDAAVPAVLQKSPVLDAALRRMLDAPLSATRLDVYLQCPLRFARQYLCRLSPVEDVNEGDDPIAVGLCIHDTLRTVYAPYLHKEVRRGDISAATVRAAFYDALDATDLRRTLPPDSLMLLETAAPVRLARFFEQQPERTLILALEHTLSAELACNGRSYSFTGTLDRLDKRDGFLHVVDYKTGRIARGDSSLWTDAGFFARAAEVCCAAPLGDAEYERLDLLFDELCERLPSLQLPCYLSLLRRAGLGRPGDAALVELRDSGAEVRLFGGLQDEDLEAALEYCDTAAALLLRRMESAPAFNARPGPRCAWCPYHSLCRA